MRKGKFNMESIRVKYNGKIYQIITEDEAHSKAPNYDWAASYMYGQDIDIYMNLKNGVLTDIEHTGNLPIVHDFPYILLKSINPYSINDYDVEKLINSQKDFEEFQEEYEGWKHNIKRNYKYNFTCKKYVNVYEAYVVEVWHETSWEEFCYYDLYDWLDCKKIYYGNEAISDFYNSLNKSDDDDCDFEHK